MSFLPEFVRIVGRANVMTGEDIPLDPPVEIHREDLDWLQAMWADQDVRDWEIMLAQRLAGAR